MNALGKYCHNFPRLAKESGYNFQLYRGIINWNDLDNVDIQEIIDDRNFQLLEQNLIHVINCNLEKEYNVKILDQNFVKLFRLAQLGIDYLSYCELYLDRCVILLQEQLSSSQMECSLLKEEIEKKDEELKRCKKKNKIHSQNYKCNLCEKIFLSEIYLESHERRRHGNSLMPNKTKKSSFSDRGQQTEEKRTISVYTQTNENKITSSNDDVQTKEEPDFKKIGEQELKIENLKRDLEELKIRLSLAEKTMEEKKKEQIFQNGFPSTVIPIIHSYITTSGYGNAHSDPTVTVLHGLANKFPTEDASVDFNGSNKPANTHEYNELPVSDNSTLLTQSLEDPAIGSGKTSPVRFSNQESRKNHDSIAPLTNSYDVKDNILHVSPKRPGGKAKNAEFPVEWESKSVDLSIDKHEIEVEDRDKSNLRNDVLETSVLPHVNLYDETEQLCESFEPRTSTPVSDVTTERGEKVYCTNKLSPPLSPTLVSGPHATRCKSKCKETVVQNMSPSPNISKTKSLLRKFVTKKSPKIQEMTGTLKNSFSQLYETVSSVGKKNLDGDEMNSVGSSKSDIIEVLNKRLKELGVDPDWSGIPRETLKQKLKILEHNRNLLNKENRFYPFLRRKLEKHVLKRLKSKSQSWDGKSLSSENLNQHENSESSEIIKRQNVLSCETVDITIQDSDSDMDILAAEKKSVRNTTKGPSETVIKVGNSVIDCNDSMKSKIILTGDDDTKVGKVTDFSIFQANRCRDPKPEIIDMDPIKEKTDISSTVMEVYMESDFDDEFSDHTDGWKTKKLGTITDTIGSFPINSSFENTKPTNQSILKNEVENGKIPSQSTTKKKVLFAEQPEILESSPKIIPGTSKGTLRKQKMYELTTVLDDDDDWSIESEWTVNNEL